MTVPTDMPSGPGEGHGHPRPPDLATITMAKSVHGATDWHCTSRVPGPDADLWRGAPSANSFFLCGVKRVLDCLSGILIRALTCTHLALDRDAPLRRAVQRSGANVAIPILSAPPLRPDVIFGKDRGVAINQFELAQRGIEQRSQRRNFCRSE